MAYCESRGGPDGLGQITKDEFFWLCSVLSSLKEALNRRVRKVRCLQGIVENRCGGEGWKNESQFQQGQQREYTIGHCDPKTSCASGEVAPICGETKLTNGEGSWWTMIQVYEYYISLQLESNMPDMSAVSLILLDWIILSTLTSIYNFPKRVELKRLEHEQQRLIQRKLFEDQMRVLEQKQAEELLSIPYEPNGNGDV
jgi:hypothetical protein